MINEELLDFTNENLLDSNIVGKRRNVMRSRQRYSNQDGGGGVDYGALATATAGLASTIASRPRNEAKDAAKMQKKQVRQERRSTKKDMKSVCGRKPLLKKKRGEWDKCVADYMKNKQPTTTPVESSQTYKTTSTSTEQDYSRPSSDSSSGKKTEKKFLGMPQTTGIIVTLVAVGVIGFVGYKMFFAKKGVAAPAAAAPAVG